MLNIDLTKRSNYWLLATGCWLTTFIIGYWLPAISHAQGLSLSVTPPLVQLTIGPGQSWSSSLKVINPNMYDLTVYASVVNFEAGNEEGHSRFIPLVENRPDLTPYSLAGWIDITQDGIRIPRGQSVEVPYTIAIPGDAAPGGHYAAILVGTRPAGGREGNVIQVSSLISALFFVRIKGDVIEEGAIREFTTGKLRYDSPEVDFLLRFENTGNVHLQPQGDITIYNMWGRERGKVPINQRTDFGNVLPKSVRKFSFTWKGEGNFFEVGRYTAITTLTYGNESRKNVMRTTHFWIVPLAPTLAILGTISFLGIFTAWGIRRYIRRALRMEAYYKGLAPAPQLARGSLPPSFWAREARAVRQDSPQAVQEGRPHAGRIYSRVLAGPILEGALDLTKAREEARRKGRLKSFAFLRFFRNYVFFFLFIFIAVFGLIFLAVYFKEVFTKERSFEVQVRYDDREVKFSDENFRE